MSRVIVRDSGGASGAREGHFEFDDARRWSDGDRDGYGDGSGGTGRGVAILLTAGGEWVREKWTMWAGESSTYRYVTAESAREWLLRNGFDDAVAEHFGEAFPEETRGRGRPEIGGAVHVRFGEELLAMVDAYAKERSINRAEAIRRLVADAVTRARVAAVPLSPRDNR